MKTISPRKNMNEFAAFLEQEYTRLFGVDPDYAYSRNHTTPEALADEMEETINQWAQEKVQRMERDDPESLWDTEKLAPGQTFAEYFAAEMRTEFINGLEEA